MKKLLDQLNIIFGAGWDEIHDLAGIGGEQIEKMVQEAEKFKADDEALMKQIEEEN